MDTRHPLLTAKSFHCSECNAINLVPPDDTELDEDRNIDSKHTMRCNRDTWKEFCKLRTDLGKTTSQTLRILVYTFKKVASRDERFDAINTIGMTFE